MSLFKNVQDQEISYKGEVKMSAGIHTVKYINTREVIKHVQGDPDNEVIDKYIATRFENQNGQYIDVKHKLFGDPDGQYMGRRDDQVELELTYFMHWLTAFKGITEQDVRDAFAKVKKPSDVTEVIPDLISKADDSRIQLKIVNRDTSSQGADAAYNIFVPQYDLARTKEPFAAPVGSSFLQFDMAKDNEQAHAEASFNPAEFEQEAEDAGNVMGW